MPQGKGRAAQGGGDPLWTFAELASALDLPVADGPSIRGLCIDSRRIQPGELFVALAGDPGPRFRASSRSDRDGHDFIADAVAKGAAAVLAHRPGDYGVPSLVVEDTVDALWRLGAAARRRLPSPVVAITGSSGKTTCKSFAAAALGAFSTAGSLNNHLGVPLSLASAPRDAAGAVLEIGTNHPGEIEPLSRMVRPEAAVVLNVGPAHIEHFGSLEAIRREKVSIARGLAPGGALVRPEGLAADFAGRAVTFGAQAQADARLLGMQGDMAELAIGGGRGRYPVPGGGEHRAMSVCAVAALLVALERSPNALHRLADVSVPAGRGNRLDAGGVTLLDESYNANPASMAATLTAFRHAPGVRRIAILGDMLELGAGSRRFHAELAGACAGLDGAFCVGTAIQALYEALPPSQRLGSAEAVDDALPSRCAALLRPGDTVLVKASNGVFWARGFVAALAKALSD